MKSLLKKSDKEILSIDLDREFIQRLYNAIYDYPDSYIDDELESSRIKELGSVDFSLTSSEGIVKVTIFSDTTVYLLDEESKPLHVANQIALMNLMFDYGYVELTNRL